MPAYDVIVLGVGGVGSAALMQLARRGVRALGIDRFPPGHDRGSSHGRSRLIRQAYFEHPDYVPLVQRSFDLWHALEQAAGQSLYRQSGLLQVGPAEGQVLRGVRESARQHGLEIESLSAAEARARFPGFTVLDEHEAVFERRAGYLRVEDCVQAHAREAQRAGAELHVDEAVRSWRAGSTGCTVETDRGTYQCEKLVITAGAWAGQLLADLGIPFEVRRKPLFWFRTRDNTYTADAGCPGFFYELPNEGCFYGIPQIDAAGVKVAEHTGGAAVADPLNVNRELDVYELERVAHFVSHFLPRASNENTGDVVCMYTMTPDEHFVVDRHPAHPQVVFAAGLSGHGFKFTPVLGEALADLALLGRTELPIGFLSASRPALRDR